MFNLKDPANPDLRAHVVTGGISPAQLVQLSPGDLANSEKAEWRRTREKMHDKEIVLDVETAAKVGGWSGGRWKWGCCRRKEGGGGVREAKGSSHQCQGAARPNAGYFLRLWRMLSGPTSGAWLLKLQPRGSH
jgi:hypothetical protein